jgi:hypothetical protein
VPPLLVMDSWRCSPRWVWVVADHVRVWFSACFWGLWFNLN